jgi:dTDP-4-amino-4,6-dideoxygalactose transaminase
VQMPFEILPEGAVSAFHILPVLLPLGVDRITVIETLKANGVQSSIHYPPFWSFTGYAGQFSAENAPLAAEISQRELTLPLYPTMTDSEVDLVTDVLLRSLA